MLSHYREFVYAKMTKIVNYRPIFTQTMFELEKGLRKIKTKTKA